MGQKKDDAPPTFVFKLNINCDDCVKTIETKAREFSGVEDVKADISTNKLTVIGNVDATKVRDYLMKEFPKKGVKLVSPLPKKDASGGNKKRGDKQEKKAVKENSDVKKEQDKEPKENESTKVNREMKKMEELIKRLTQELENKRIKAEKDLQEKDKLIRKLELKCQKTRERAKRQACAICWTKEDNMVFQCGHTTCEECGKELPRCPICRADISIRIKVRR